MIERAVVEYIANALWQVPLLAGGAWLFLWAVRPGPRIQHGVWLAVLGLAVMLPVHGMGSGDAFAMQAGQMAVGSGAGTVAGTVFAPGFAPALAPVAAPEALEQAQEKEQVGVSGEPELPPVKKDARRRDWLAIAPRVRRVPLTERAVNWL